MKYKITTAMLLLYGCMASTVCAQVAQKVGNNPYAINPSAALEVESTTKGLLYPRMTTAQRDAITAPVAGLNIYNTTTNCVEWYNGTVWFNACVGGASANDPSSNGTAVVFTYNCAKPSTGTMVAGTEVSGVTQTITATVTTAGTYSIATMANGVTFFGSGTFAGTGSQDIVLTASGIPTSGGVNSFTLNTTPNCSFNRTTANASSNGTAVVSTYNCATASAGSMMAGTAVSGVTQTITASVTTVGTYSIATTTTNGVTFSGSGTFAGTGNQSIVLTASGIPSSAGVNSFTLNTNPNCSFSRTTGDASSGGTAVVSGYSCATASAGTMNAGYTVSGVTQTITASVTTAGTYIIATTTANGVTFSGSGTFAGTGQQNIVLTASGTPNSLGSNSFTLNTNPNCNFSRNTIGCGAYIAAGVFKAFMCHNLGATTTLDPNVPVQGIYGNHYQWGRSTVVANASTASGAISGWNSTTAANGSWLEDSKTANDPCPAGFKIPTNNQWTGVVANNTVTRSGTWSNDSNNFTAAIHFGPDASTKTLTVPTAGQRQFHDGSLNLRGSHGLYWTSTQASNDSYAKRFYFTTDTVTTTDDHRCSGLPVRCISE